MGERLTAAREALARLRDVPAESDRLQARAVLREHIDHIAVYFGDPRPGDKSRFDRAAVYAREDSPLRFLADPAANVVSQTPCC